MIKITAGSKYIDIDAYASCIAYAKLLNSLGLKAEAVSFTNNFSKSITQSLKNSKYKMNIVKTISDKVIILDVSNPNMIDKNVLNSEVIEVIDHHPYKDAIIYWEKRNTNTIIEEIGSVCTIIYEKIKAADKLNILDYELCKLLAAGILDNTLNLKAKITKERDVIAYKELIKIGNLDNNFSKQYFQECQNEIEKDIINTIENDLKTDLEFNGIPKVFGQMLIINIESIFNKKQIIIDYMNSKYDEWIINFICLDDGKSYIMCDSENTSQKINTILKQEIINNVIIMTTFKLRKEILKLFT